MNAAVFLARDNTMIQANAGHGDPQQVRLIQGAASAIASLCGLGYRVVVIHNEPAVARGQFSEEEVQQFNQHIAQIVQQSANGARIDRFYFCPFDPAAKVKRYKKNHPERLPNPGLILRAAKEMGIDLTQSWTIGDESRDIKAGATAGTRTILLRKDAASLAPLDISEQLVSLDLNPDDEQQLSRLPTFYAPTLIEAVRIIAQQRKPEVGEEIQRPAVGARRWDKQAIARLQKSPAKLATGDLQQLEQEKRQLEGRQAANDPAVPTPPPFADPPPAGQPSKLPRPFRPWGAPEPPEPQTSTSDAAALTQRQGNLPSPDAISAGSVERREPPPQRKASSAESPTPHSAHPPDASSRAGSREVPQIIREARERRAEQAQQEENAATRSTSSSDALEDPQRVNSTHKLLKMILNELRNQRGHGEEFSYLTLIAIVLQTLAVVCLLGGLWMGTADDGLFLRWIAAALIAQLATIAMLLFAKGP